MKEEKKHKVSMLINNMACCYLPVKLNRGTQMNHEMKFTVECYAVNTTAKMDPTGKGHPELDPWCSMVHWGQKGRRLS